MAWTLDEALDFIRDLQPCMTALNYHVCLGGGVLNKGESEKDLDLFILPLNGYESAAREVVKELATILGHSRALRDGPDYYADAHFHFQEAYKFTYNGKRIDIFIQ